MTVSSHAFSACALAVALPLSLAAVPCLADPAPFGLELGKATVTEAKAHFDLDEKGTNRYSGGPMFSVPVSEVDFDGLQDLTLIFNSQNTLVGVLATLPKQQFSSMHGMLSGKYRVVSTNIPFVGNSSAKYVDGGTEITLDAPHMSFEMSMNYLRKELQQTFEKQSAEEARQKASRRAGQL